MTNMGLKRKMIAGGIMALMFSCTACSSNENTPAPQTPSNVVETPQTDGDNFEHQLSQQQLVQDNGQEDPEAPSLSWYFENLDLQGHVVEFSEDGFTLSAVESYEDEDGGQVAVGAVVGEEDLDSLVTVSYSENVIFEIVAMDAACTTMISRETVGKEAVKKQSSVFIYGTCQDTRNWMADRVVIVRYGR